jgi:hypothetical protein
VSGNTCVSYELAERVVARVLSLSSSPRPRAAGTGAFAQLDAADVRPSGLEGAQLRARFHGGRRQLVALAGPAAPALIAQAAAVDVAGALFLGDGRQGRSGRHTLCEEVAPPAGAACLIAVASPRRCCAPLIRRRPAPCLFARSPTLSASAPGGGRRTT